MSEHLYMYIIHGAEYRIYPLIIWRCCTTGGPVHFTSLYSVKKSRFSFLAYIIVQYFYIHIFSNYYYYYYIIIVPAFRRPPIYIYINVYYICKRVGSSIAVAATMAGSMNRIHWDRDDDERRVYDSAPILQQQGLRRGCAGVAQWLFRVHIASRSVFYIFFLSFDFFFFFVRCV